jgi:hypothetical protein
MTVNNRFLSSRLSQAGECARGGRGLPGRHESDMKLYPLDTPELLELAASWLARKENYQWLDFGSGRQIITPALLKIMTQRETHFLRAFTSDRDDVPIGIVGLNSVDRTFNTAMFRGGGWREILPQPGIFDRRRLKVSVARVPRPRP